MREQDYHRLAIRCNSHQWPRSGNCRGHGPVWNLVYKLIWSNQVVHYVHIFHHSGLDFCPTLSGERWMAKSSTREYSHYMWVPGSNELWANIEFITMWNVTCCLPVFQLQGNMLYICACVCVCGNKLYTNAKSLCKNRCHVCKLLNVLQVTNSICIYFFYYISTSWKQPLFRTLSKCRNQLVQAGAFHFEFEFDHLTAMSNQCGTLGSSHISLAFCPGFLLADDVLYKCNNALVPYPTIYHIVTVIWTCVPISITKWCIRGTCLMHHCICEFGLFEPGLEPVIYGEFTDGLMPWLNPLGTVQK